MIKKLLKSLFTEQKVECAVDEQSVDCTHLDDDQDKAYTGIPAPILSPVDDWFPEFHKEVVTKKQVIHKMTEQIRSESEMPSTKEPENIHQLMYDKSMASGETSIQRDPIGGSEVWQSGR